MAHTEAERQQLLRDLEAASKAIPKGSNWAHRDTGLKYVVMHLGIIEKTLEVDVEYEDDDHLIPWHRPISIFLSRFIREEL